MNAEQNIWAGFTKSGIVPAAERLPVEPEQVDLANEDAAANVEAMDDSIVSLLKEMRYGPEGQLPIKQKSRSLLVRVL